MGINTILAYGERGWRYCGRCGNVQGALFADHLVFSGRELNELFDALCRFALIAIFWSQEET